MEIREALAGAGFDGKAQGYITEALDTLMMYFNEVTATRDLTEALPGTLVLHDGEETRATWVKTPRA